ncbi:MAG: Gfo/Idh/MocA family oxidoreductase [Pseudomonadota bacterium]
MMIPAAVIGCGRMGAFTSASVRTYSPSYWLPLSHADALALHPDVALKAFCDVDPQAVERAREAHDVAAGFTDLHEMLDQVRPRLLGIATRTVGRTDIIETALGRGVEALHVEKPLCNTVAELDRLEALLDRSGVHITLGTVRRHLDVYRVARGLAGSGAYGAISEIRGCFGPGALYWSHPHTVDLILYLAAGREVVGVQAHLSNVEYGDRKTRIESDPIVDFAIIMFDDGVIAHIGRALGMNVEIACERGSVTVLSDGHAIELMSFEGDNPYPVREHFDGKVDLLPPQGSFGPVSQLVSCLKGDKDALLSNADIKRDIVRGQRILFAMMQSHLCNSTMIGLDAVDPELDIRALTAGRPA